MKAAKISASKRLFVTAMVLEVDGKWKRRCGSRLRRS